jgi:hypothetical protein
MIMLHRVSLASAAALIATMTASVKAMDTADLAGRSGFLIGAARHCGVSATRLGYVQQWIAVNLAATAETRQVTDRFNGFVEAASAASSDGEFPVRCKAVAGACSALESHIVTIQRKTPRAATKTPNHLSR